MQIQVDGITYNLGYRREYTTDYFGRSSWEYDLFDVMREEDEGVFLPVVLDSKLRGQIEEIIDEEYP